MSPGVSGKGSSVASRTPVLMEVEMDREQLVERLVQVVRRYAVDGTIANLKQPPGSSPAEDLVAASIFYNGLCENEKNIVNSIVSESVDTAMILLLSAVDGVLNLLDGDSEFVLEARDADGRNILSSSSNDCHLNELFKIAIGRSRQG